MKQEKSYEEKIADIKKYLREKEAEVEKNKITEVRKNPVEKKLDNIYDNGTSMFNEEDNYYSDITKKSRVDEYDKIEKNNNEEKNVSSSNKSKFKKLNIPLIIGLLLTPILITIAVIGMNSTYLIKEPFNYVMIGLSGISLVATICLLLLKLISKPKDIKVLKYVITIIVVSIMDVLFTIIFIYNKMWKKLDPILEHKKIFIIVILVLLLIVGIVLIIRKIMHKKLNNKVRSMIFTIIITLYILCYFDLLIILYGPVNEFKNWLITTAMQTMNHQYLCKWFYSDKTIEAVLSQNYVLESGESTNPDLIDVEKEKPIVYENEYEEAVLKKDNPDDPYKIINLDVNGCKGYLAVIYDPTTVHVGVTKYVGRYGQYVTEMASDRNALLAINGGGFYDPGNSSTGGSPTGITISEGKIITNGEYGNNVQSGGIIGFDDKGVMYLLKNTTAQQAINMGITDAVSWGPFLIVNGEPSFIKGNGGWGYAARTAIGQRKDGIVLFLVVDSNTSRTNGADMVDLTEIMQNYGAINAANLDGGTSSVMVLPKEKALKYNSNCKDSYCTINDPIDGALRHQTRAIADSFVVIEN